MKRTILYIASLVLVIGVLVAYHFSFPIKSDLSNLEGYINSWANRGYSTRYPSDIDLHDSISIDDLIYTSMQLDGELGYLLLEKGITGRYKINHFAHGGGNFRNGVIESRGNRYLLFIGRNAFSGIAGAQFIMDTGCQYYMDIPRQDIFLLFTRVDNKTELGPVSLDRIKLYNEKGEDISPSIDLSGGGIQ